MQIKWALGAVTKAEITSGFDPTTGNSTIQFGFDVAEALKVRIRILPTFELQGGGNIRVFPRAGRKASDAEKEFVKQVEKFVKLDVTVRLSFFAGRDDAVLFGAELTILGSAKVVTKKTIG